MLVRDKLNSMPISDGEKQAVTAALDAGTAYGYGNVMAWLATEWAVKLRDNHGLSEAAAIDAVSGRSPYGLPEKEVKR